MSAINEYEQYRGYFGFPLDRGTAATGIVYAIYTIGNLVGSFFAGPATDLRGNRFRACYTTQRVNLIKGESGGYLQAP